jgi:amino acid adenylation domain-containing protein
MWLLDRLYPRSPVHNVVTAFRIDGALDVAALRAALEIIVARHDALRTTFRLAGSEPRAHLQAAIGCEVRVVAVSPEECEAAIDAEVCTPFDLERGPLFRFLLLAVRPTSHVFVMSFHHVISDRRSVRIVLAELEQLYAMIVAGDPAPTLEPLPLYAEIVRRQRERLNGGHLARLRAYWSAQLAGPLPTLELPTDKPRPAERRLEAGCCIASLDPGLIGRVRELGRTEGASLLATALTAFSVLLHRYTGQDDLLIGTPFSGRLDPQAERVFGCFINTLPIRVQIDPRTGFRSLLYAVRERLAGAARHQELPLEMLIDDLEIVRTPSLPPLYQVLFTRENTAEQKLRLGDRDAQGMFCPYRGVHVDLRWSIVGEEDDLSIAVGYDRALFRRESIDRMIGHYLTLLGAIVDDPECAIAALPLLDASQRRQMLVGWNATAAPYDGDRCVHERFAAIVRRTPDAPAVIFEDRTLTYRELDAHSNRLAHALRASGIGRGTPVAVAVERSFEMIVGVLAILKAGGAYVPLDPTYPDERLQQILSDCAPPAILTQRHLRPRLPETAVVLVLDAEGAELAHFPPDVPPPNVTDPDQAAYIVYTSGSTGRPKGVAVPHRAIMRLVTGTDYVPFGPDLSIAQVSNFSFDAATFELWGSLLHGSRLVIVPQEVLLEPARFIALLEEQRIGAMFVTSAFFNQIAGLSPDAFGGVAHLLVGGEALDLRMVRRVLAARRPGRLLNAYGPTETTTFACTFDVDELAEDATSVPIGRPIANTRTYILDKNRQPVPIGVPGELYIGGPGVAVGYLNAPELTASKFIADPFSADPPGLLYRTGDLVRYRADGAIEFLGRLDHQVKVRGFRIELGEIEAALQGHPDVREAVVVVREDTPNDKRLVAYVVAGGVDHAALRAFLAKKLPEYMLPAATVILDRFPLTANGKVDRKALPSPSRPQGSSCTPPAEPRTPLEVQLAAIWEDVLNRAPIGRDENFFELGGNSLLAIQTIARIERATGTSVPVRMFFERPTIGLLAEAIVSGRPSVRRARYVAVRQAGTRRPFFLLHGYFDGGLYAVNLSRHLGPEQPFYALHPHDSDGADEPIPPTIEAMAEDHYRVIRTIQPHGPYALGGFCNGAHVAYEIARMMRDAGERVDVLAIFSTRAPARSLHLRKAVAFFARVRGLSRDQEVLSYLAWRRRAGHLTPKRFLPLLLRRLTSARVGGGSAGAAADGETPESAPLEYRFDGRGFAYADAISRYAPGPYDGTITLVWGREAYDPSDDPVKAWSAFAKRVEFHLVPGGANSSLTNHADAVAAVLRDALDRARGPGELRVTSATSSR